MKTSVVRNSQKSGLPPGALIHIGNKKTEPIKLSKFTYNENDFEENEYEDLCTNKDWTNEDDERYHQWVLEQQEEEEQMLNDSLYDEEKERRAGFFDEF